MSEKERNHYLPEFYLKAFGKNGFIYRYDRKEDVYKYLSTRDAAVIKNYYTATGLDGSKDKRIEDYFNFIETRSTKVLVKIDNQEKINEIEKVYLSTFISYLMVRGPNYEKFFNEAQEKYADSFLKNVTKNKEIFNQLISEYERRTKKKLDIDTENAMDIVKKMKLHLPKEHRLQHMLDFGFQQSKLIFNMDMIILKATEGTSFITSDNPFIFWSEGLKKEHDSVGLLTPDTSKVIPLTKNSCLVIGNLRGENSIFEYLPKRESKAGVRVINQTIAYYSDRYIFGQDEALLKKIARSTKLYDYEITSRVKVELNIERGIIKIIKKNEIKAK